MKNENLFLIEVENAEFPLGDFNHEAHVRLAWIYLRKNALPEAMVQFRNTLKKFAAHYGKNEIYHETITLCFLLLIHDRIQRFPGEKWPEFFQGNQDIFRNGREILAKLYHKETLESVASKSCFQLPDLLRSALTEKA